MYHYIYRLLTRRLLLALCLVASPHGFAAPLQAVGNAAPPTSAQPVRRIVSLAPSLTELLFAAGAGDRVVGVVDHSDYPPAARALPRVGSYASLDLEAILALKPDLIVAWRSGNPAPQVAHLAALGMPVYQADPQRLADIPLTLRQLGRLAGTGATAERAAARFEARLATLKARYAQRPPVPLFYEIWNRPLMSIGGKQMITDVIDLCGGRNIFANLNTLAPQVSREAVLAADPEAIIVSGMGATRPDWLNEWKRWPQLTAVKRGNLFVIPPDIIQRQSPRILDGAQQLCRDLEQVRARRQ